MVLLFMVEVVLVLVKPNSPPKNKMLVNTRNIGGFVHLRMSAQHHP